VQKGNDALIPLTGESTMISIGCGAASRHRAALLVPDTRGHLAVVASSASIDSMATLTIRQLDEKTKTRLRVRAAHHGRSMEEEAREILRSALSSVPPAKGNLAEAIRRRFAAFGGLELKLPRRDAVRQAPGFAE
jgi:antitoxin FitA